MPKPKNIAQDTNDIARALHNWFVAQDISPAMAAMAMGYLIGVMAANEETDPQQIKAKLESIKAVMDYMAVHAYEANL